MESTVGGKDAAIEPPGIEIVYKRQPMDGLMAC